jgi:hypothetical protein
MVDMFVWLDAIVYYAFIRLFVLVVFCDNVLS